MQSYLDDAHKTLEAARSRLDGISGIRFAVIAFPMNGQHTTNLQHRTLTHDSARMLSSDDDVLVAPSSKKRGLMPSDDLNQMILATCGA